MPIDKQEQKLVNYFKDWGFSCTRDCGVGSGWCDCGNEKKVEFIVNFILSDRKRIVEPLVKYCEIRDANWMSAMKVINQTLCNAGIGD